MFIHQVTSAKKERRGLFGLQVKLPSDTNDGDFTLSHLLLNVKARKQRKQNLWFDPTGNWARVYRFSSRRFIHSAADWYSHIKILYNTNLFKFL